MKFSVKDFFIFCAVTVLLFHYYKPHKDDVNCNIKKIILDLSSGKNNIFIRFSFVIELLFFMFFIFVH